MANSMYAAMKNVILGKGVPVAELRRRVNVFFAQGDITDGQKTELDQMIFDNQTPDAEKAGLEERYAALIGRLDALEERVAALEGGSDEGSGGDGGSYPVWKAWDGVSTDYQYGAIVTHNGKIWQNVLQSMQNVWEPGAVDERYWVEIVA